MAPSLTSVRIATGAIAHRYVRKLQYSHTLAASGHSATVATADTTAASTAAESHGPAIAAVTPTPSVASSLSLSSNDNSSLHKPSDSRRPTPASLTAVDDFDSRVARLFHQEGVNLRYLGVVRYAF